MSAFIADSCLLCGQPSNHCISLCNICENNLPRLDIKNIKNNNSIITQPQYWNTLYTFFHYEKGIKKLIQSFKFGKNQVAGDILKNIFYLEIIKNIKIENQFDVIIPMPIHKRRNLTRGFNQTYFLSQTISNQCNIPINSNYVYRAKHTKFQNKLSTTNRQENIINAFKLRKKYNYQRVLIIDDIITTGNSINELSKILKQSGINEITVCTIAISQG